MSVMKYTPIRRHLKPVHLQNGIFIWPNESGKDKQVRKFLREVLNTQGIEKRYVIEPYDAHKLKKRSLVVQYDPWARENPWVEINVIVGVDPDRGSWAANLLAGIEIPASVRFYNHTNSSQLDDSVPQVKVKVNGYEMIADLAVKHEASLRGLGGVYIKDHIERNEGLLHVFEDKGQERHPFWTKELRTSIDLIWLDSEGMVVHAEEKVEPCRTKNEPNRVCPNYDPEVMAAFLLEVPAGFVEEHEMRAGSHIDFESVY